MKPKLPRGIEEKVLVADGFEIIHSDVSVYAFKAFPERCTVLKQEDDGLFYLHRTHETPTKVQDR